MADTIVMGPGCDSSLMILNELVDLMGGKITIYELPYQVKQLILAKKMAEDNAAKYLSAAQRTQADFVAYQRRIQAERASAMQFDSPQEEEFWKRWQATPPFIPISVHYPVFGGRYRLDFAHLPSKTAIELDGFTYHRDADKFQADRRRDRELTNAGWRVIRFASAELRDDLDRCISEAHKIITTKAG
jgi:very-short-patch-repair endonuclease